MNRINELDKISRRIIKGLRHTPTETFNIELDKYGYINVQTVLKTFKIKQNELDYIVDSNNKKRFEYNSNKTKIRATQGHTINIEFDLEPTKPPTKLYHRTTEEAWRKIKSVGLLKMKRHHVHLTENKNISKKPILLEIDSESMYNDNIQFFKTSNNVWLTEKVESIYIKIKYE